MSHECCSAKQRFTARVPFHYHLQAGQVLFFCGFAHARCIRNSSCCSAFATSSMRLMLPAEPRNTRFQEGVSSLLVLRTDRSMIPCRSAFPLLPSSTPQNSGPSRFKVAPRWRMMRVPGGYATVSDLLVPPYGSSFAAKYE